MTTEIEDRVRAALKAGAAAITDEAQAAAPVWDAAAPRRAQTPRPLVRRHWAWLATAACVAVVAALAVGLRGGGRSTPPATSQSSTAPAPSTTSSPPLPDANGIHPAACVIALPSSWQRAFMDGRVPSPGASVHASDGLPIMAMTPSGDVVSSTSELPQKLVLVRPDHSLDPLYTVPGTIPGQGDAHLSGDAQADAQWVVFSLIVGGGQGARGGIYAVDIKSHQVRTVRSTDLGTLPIVSPPALLDGRVYWSEVSSAGVGSVYQYDLASGTRTTLDTGQVSWPVAIGGGLFWTNGSRTVEQVHATLPPGYVVQPTKANVLLQDGGTRGWVGTAGPRPVLQMMTAQHLNPVTVFTAAMPDTVLTPLALSGPYLVWSDGDNITVLDTRTGASTDLEQTGGLSVGIDSAAAANGMIALTQTGSKGGAQLSIAKAAELPELHC